MAQSLHNGLHTHRQSIRVRMGVWVTILVACFILYFVVVLRYLSIGSSPNGWLLTAHNNGGNSNISQSIPSPVKDAFVLHPEKHIFRAPQKIQLRWNITREARRPDGVLKEVYLINGMCPQVIITVTYLLTSQQDCFQGQLLKQGLGMKSKLRLSMESPMTLTMESLCTGTACS